MRVAKMLVIAAPTVVLATLMTYAGSAGPRFRSDAQGPPPLPPPPQRPGPPPPTAPAPPVAPVTPPSAGDPTPTTSTYTDSTGQFTTINGSDGANLSNLFFHALGANGRACVTCHAPDEGWSITPTAVRALFNQTQGLAPLFRPVDGADSPDAPVATLAERQAAYSELLNDGLIRIGLPIPAGAQFKLTSVDDPYHYASASELSLFRRPLPVTNLPFLSTVMFDGRFTLPGASLEADLIAQATNAIETHEQSATKPSAAELQEIVAFESANFTAQSFDDHAGSLDADGALGGPVDLSVQPFTLGINDPLAGNPPGSLFNENAMTIYTAWQPEQNEPPQSTAGAQASIARGERIFDSRQFVISNVPGFNDVIGRSSVVGTCTTCHNTPNVGDHSLPVYIDLGLTDPARTAPGLPLYTLTNMSNGDVRVTSDPGRALVTGKWSDIGKFKVPTLRGLASRPPYFHNGFAPGTNAVIGFYNQRFQIGLSPQEQQDLNAFLNSL